MKTNKVVYFDIDGTLYSHRVHDVSESTKHTLWALKEKGHKIVSATSRCRREMAHLPSFIRTFPFDGEIYDGGALILEKGVLLKKFPIAQQEIQTIVKWVKQHPVPFRYASFDGDYMHADCGSDVLDRFFRLYLMMPDIKPYQQEEVFNILLYTHTPDQAEMIATLLQDIHMVKHSSTTLEITAKGVGKDHGVKILNDHWNVAIEDCICCGDGANDIAMLRSAGCGIAMGNGEQRVKDAADFVTKHIDADGIAHAFQTLKLI